MRNDKFGGNNSVQLSISQRLGLLSPDQRIDVELKSGEVISGLIISSSEEVLRMTIIGTDDEQTIKIDNIKEFLKPNFSPRDK